MAHQKIIHLSNNLMRAEKYIKENKWEIEDIFERELPVVANEIDYYELIEKKTEDYSTGLNKNIFKINNNEINIKLGNITKYKNKIIKDIQKKAKNSESLELETIKRNMKDIFNPYGDEIFILYYFEKNEETPTIIVGKEIDIISKIEQQIEEKEEQKLFILKEVGDYHF